MLSRSQNICIDLVREVKEYDTMHNSRNRTRVSTDKKHNHRSTVNDRKCEKSLRRRETVEMQRHSNLSRNDHIGCLTAMVLTFREFSSKCTKFK